MQTAVAPREHRLGRTWAHVQLTRRGDRLTGPNVTADTTEGCRNISPRFPAVIGYLNKTHICPG